ncbi:hypothetical protein, partial [Streptomyces sp. NPDC002913]
MGRWPCTPEPGRTDRPDQAHRRRAGRSHLRPGKIGGGRISRDVYNVVPTSKLTDSVIASTFV